VRRLTRRDVIKAMEANADRVRFANYIPAVLSVLLEHAIDIGWTSGNPAKGVRKMKTPKAKEQPHIPWPDWAVERWRAEAGPLPRLIFEIGVGSVQRPGDWPVFRWSDYDGSALRITQGKTEKSLWLPCTDHLRAALDSASKCGLTILTLQDGRPLNYRRMAQIMLDERKRLDLVTYDLHALRYRGVMELAWAGCDDDEIASYSGHASKDMIHKYAGEARQRMRAAQAAAKRR
jgi:integrase